MNMKTVIDAARRNNLEEIKRLTEGKNIPQYIQENITYTAAENDYLNIVKYIDEKYPSFLERNKGISHVLFHRALQHGSINVVKYLNSKKNPHKIADKELLSHETPPLLSAVEYGQRELIEYFITENIGWFTDNQHLIVCKAIESNQLEILKYLIEEKGVNIYTITDEGKYNPLLFLAARKKHYDILKYLVEEKKFNLTMVNKNGENIMFDAVIKGDLDLIKFVLDDQKTVIDINSARKDGCTLVHQAVKRGYTMDVLQYLVEKKKADVNKPDAKGKAPLHYVIEKNICSYLIDHGAHIDLEDLEGNTPLQAAVSLCMENLWYFKVPRMLIDRGADINHQNKRGRTPLHTATVRYSYCSIGSYLVKSGADVNLPDNSSETALHYIARGVLDGYDDELNMLLIEGGADTNLENKHGKTPLDIAFSKAVHADPVFSSYPLQMCEYLINNGANVNRTNKKGDTLLHKAITLRFVKLSESLIERGAGLNARNRKGETPLHLASSYGLYDVCKLLIRYGADTQLQDLEGKTPVQRTSDAGIIKILKNSNTTNTRKRRDVAVPFLEYKYQYPATASHFIQENIHRGYSGAPNIQLGAPIPLSLGVMSLPTFPNFFALL